MKLPNLQLKVENGRNLGDLEDEKQREATF